MDAAGGRGCAPVRRAGDAARATRGPRSSPREAPRSASRRSSTTCSARTCAGRTREHRADGPRPSTRRGGAATSGRPAGRSASSRPAVRASAAATGGGHGPGRGTPGKSEFPGRLTDAQIIEGVERIANDPMSYPEQAVPTGLGRYEALGRIGDTPVKVVVEPQGEGVITAHPIGVERNPR